MPLFCPDCTKPSLKIGDRIELSPDSRWDEIALQVIACEECGFAGIGVYQESRRGGMDDETVEHTGFRVDTAEVDHVRSLIQQCGSPDDRKCSCSAHTTLNQQNEQGRWTAMDHLFQSEYFQIQYSR